MPKPTKKNVEEIKEYFKQAMEKGHYCIFKKRDMSLEEIVGDEEQFRLCCWCRINNILLAVSNLKNRLARIEQCLGGVRKKASEQEEEEAPSYIG